MARDVGRAVVVSPDYLAKRIDAEGVSISRTRVSQRSVSAGGPDKAAGSAAAQRVATTTPPSLMSKAQIADAPEGSGRELNDPE